MSTTADFVGKNCPHCGAVDSLQTDDAHGEVACMECALVVAMGLEENALTRYNEDATYDDVDRHRERDEANTSTSLKPPLPSSPSSINVVNVTLHPAMLNCIRSLQKKSGVPEQTIGRAVELAKQLVGGRRARGQRVERQQDIAAACFMIAAEQMNHPVPLAELRCLDASFGDVEYRRAEIVKELRMEEEERRLKTVFVENLLTTYILKLGLQVSIYLPHCRRLLSAISRVEALAHVVVVDRAIMALLLARTSQSFEWEGTSMAITSTTTNTITSIAGGHRGAVSVVETLYDNFSAKAHLDAGKVRKLMQTASDNLSDIVAAFEAADSTSKHNRNENGSDAASGTKRMKVEKA